MRAHGSYASGIEGSVTCLGFTDVIELGCHSMCRFSASGHSRFCFFYTFSKWPKPRQQPSGQVSVKIVEAKARLS